MISKTCNVCHESKALDQFHKDKSKPDGHQRRCKACDSAKKATYREEHREQLNAYQAAHNQSPKGRFTTYKAGAKARGISFDLSFDEFMSFWQADCSYCGDQIATVGIDRVDSNVGYTLANCIPCCWECNRIKSDRENEPLNMHMLKMLKHQGII